MSSISLREFIDRREAEIKEMRAALLLELKELKAARAAIESNTSSLSNTAEKRPQSSDSGNSDRTLTIKEMVMAVLETRDGKGTAEEIKSWIFNDFSKDVARSSLSPQLSRLKDERSLNYDQEGGIWVALKPDPEGNSASEVLDLDLGGNSCDPDLDSLV